jgi:glutamyl-tRNA synthetase
MLGNSDPLDAVGLETGFKALADGHAIKPGELMLPFRIMLVGGKFGPHVFDIAMLWGKQETIARIDTALTEFSRE